jgi:uncharacterized protein with NRDE domain
MCVLALAWHAHPRWQLVVVGNRDEYHLRPAAPLARWEKDPSLIAGRDLQSGGTWLGVSEEGRFVIVTNLRGHGGPEAGRPSRGALVTDLLKGANPDDIAMTDYNPVNLITLDSGRARFLSNRPQPLRIDLSSGLYGLSNGTLDEPWPKTLRLKSVLLDWLTTLADDPAPLLDGLREEVLPDIGLAPIIASDVPQEPNDSPIFIRNAVYGTRCSSVVMIDHRGHGLFVERRFDGSGYMTGQTRLDFRWPA